MKKKIILVILILGFLYKLQLTWGGNFLFNMDNARDMVDVREMIVLKKLRLTGPTSAIEGLFNGPAWYYLLVVPFIISSGDPYASIIMEIILWAIGGYFLLQLVSKLSNLLVIPIGILWIASNYIGLTTVYAFNPNPVTLLSPLFLYLLYKYLTTSKLVYSISAWFLGGLFFNLEMNFGVFIPPIFFVATFLISKFFPAEINKNLLKQKNFWLGSLFYLVTILPQILFDLKHQFLMTNSVINFLRNEPRMPYNFANRFQLMLTTFYNTFTPTMFNNRVLTIALLIASIPVLIKYFKIHQKNTILLVSLSFILIPFIGYLFLPINVNPWHLGGVMVAAIILTAFVIKGLWGFSFLGKIYSISLYSLIIWASLANILNYFLIDRKTPSQDPSLYKNEIAAIDYVYQKAEGKNFKAYTYLPSVIDYPYQYLFWWYGKKKYGYIPGEYVYSPDKPQYISNKDKFDGDKNNFSGLVFLIKEPDRIKLRQAWENDFKDRQYLSKEMIGPIEVEIRKE